MREQLSKAMLKRKKVERVAPAEEER